MPHKGKKLALEEIQYIRDHCLGMPDEEIAKKLGRNLITVRRARVKLGVTKGYRGKVNEINPNSSGKLDSIASAANAELNEIQRKEFYRSQFTNSLYYTNLKEQFTKEEIDFYLEEWGSLCIQFEDVVATEKRQIDEYIKMTLLGFRILRNINTIEEEIGKLQKEVEQWRKSHPKIQEEPESQERDDLMLDMISSMNAQAKSIARDYQQNLEMRTKLLGELNARRKDRVDQILKRGTTFQGLVEEFRNAEVRKNQGRHMELLRLAKEKKKREWRKPIKFADGESDCILLDENSEVPQVEIVKMYGEAKNVAEEFAASSGKRILIVEDDPQRSQFFADIFKENIIEFASSVQKAYFFLNNKKIYDLICFDYDLGLNAKGDAVAKFMVKHGICRSAKVLIHSENPEGVEKISTALKNYSSYEIMPFYQIRDKFKKEGVVENATECISGGAGLCGEFDEGQGPRGES